MSILHKHNWKKIERTYSPSIKESGMKKIDNSIYYKLAYELVKAIGEDKLTNQERGVILDMLEIASRPNIIMAKPKIEERILKNNIDK